MLKSVFSKFILASILLNCSLNASSNEYIDLTKLNNIMLYSFASQLALDGESYLNSTIKVRGKFERIKADEGIGANEYYYAISIYDTTMCCVQVIELQFSNSNLLNSIKNNDIITVEGIYSKQDFDGLELFYLQVTKLM